MTRVRTHLQRLAIALLLTLAVSMAGIIGGVAPASAQQSGSSGNDNTAIAVNTKDGSSLFRFAFGITRATGDVVDAGNAAVAYASCTECQTVAVAIQFVIVEGSPSTFTPTNLAIAENVACTLCETMASAYQIVIQTSGPVRLTAEGHRELEKLVQQLRSLDIKGAGVDQLNTTIDGIVKQMTQIMSTQLVPVTATGDEAKADAATTTTTARDTASTTSTTEVRSSSTTTAAPATSTTTPRSTTTTTAPDTSTTAPTTTAAP